MELRKAAKEGEGNTWCNSVTVVENSQDSRAIRGTLPFVQCELCVIKVYRRKKMVEPVEPYLAKINCDSSGCEQRWYESDKPIVFAFVMVLHVSSTRPVLKLHCVVWCLLHIQLAAYPGVIIASARLLSPVVVPLSGAISIQSRRQQLHL
jgi:hypothetical protein